MHDNIVIKPRAKIVKPHQTIDNINTLRSMWGLFAVLCLGLIGVGALISVAIQTPTKLKVINGPTIEKISQTTNKRYNQLVKLDETQAISSILSPQKYQATRNHMLTQLGPQLMNRYNKLDAIQTYNGIFNDSTASNARLAAYMTLSIYRDDLYTNQIAQAELNHAANLAQQVGSSSEPYTSQMYVLSHQRQIIYKHATILRNWIKAEPHPSLKNLPYLKLNPMVVTTSYSNAYFDLDYDSPTNKQNKVILALANGNGPNHPSSYGPYLNLNNGNYVPLSQAN